jgi:ABC-type transport system substrate-binding protein
MAARCHPGVMLVTIAIAFGGCTTPGEPERALEPVAPTTGAAPPSGDPAPDPTSGRGERLEAVTIANVLEPPLDDVRVRQALALALDHDAVAASSGLDPATTRFGFTVASPGPTTDRDEARSLVAAYRDDPGRSDGEPPGAPIRVGYRCPHDPSLHPRTVELVAQWGRIGVEVTPEVPEMLVTEVMGHQEPAEADPFVARGSWRGSYQVACWALPADEPSLDALLDFVGEQTSSPSNVTNVDHPTVAEARDALRASEPAGVDHVATIVRTLEREGVVIWHGVISRAQPPGSSDP